jgi:hypothetical protein
MKVYFTNHAHKRCRQCGINSRAVYEEVRSLPDFQGKFHWTHQGNTIVLEKGRDGKVIIIKTVIAKFKFRNQHMPERKGRLVNR